MKVTSIMFYLGLIVMLYSSVAAQAEGTDLSILTNAKSPFVDGDIVVTLGDSITQFGDGPDGYVTLLRNAFAKVSYPAVTIINAGISGNEVPDLQARYERDVLSKNPTVVFIYIGINDVWHHGGDLGDPRTKFETGLRQIIHKMQQQGIRVVLATPSVIGEKPDGTNPVDKSLDAFSDTSRNIAKDMHLELCDLRKAFIEYLKIHNTEGKDLGVLTQDTVHLNAAGNRLVAHEAAKSLIAALGRKMVPLVIYDTEFTDQGIVAINFLPKQNTAGLVIRYTLNGTAPTAKSPRYTKPIKVNKSTIITAQAFMKNKAAGYAISATATKLPSQ